MRLKVIAGNWKMFKTNSEAKGLINGIKEKTKEIIKTQIIVCPPFTALTLVSELSQDSKIGVGAQNMYWEDQGAYTGEISAQMIKNTGAKYVLLGHSERRQYFYETDETVNKKLHKAIKNELNPIVCIGETLEQRESGVTKEVVGGQVEKAFVGISPDSAKDTILAYEPVWAIGTGKTASPDQAQDVHAFIRQIVAKLYGNSISDNIIILYGGSVKPTNATELLSQQDIDGALVGGACLEADSFVGIITAAEKL